MSNSSLFTPAALRTHWVVRLGNKGGMTHSPCTLNVWVQAGETLQCDPSLTLAIPERPRDGYHP